MQTYLNFIDQADALIEKASFAQKVQTGVDICKKLYPDFEAYSTSENAEFLRQAIQFCENFPDDADTTAANVLARQIKDLTPADDGLTSWKITNAANAVNAVHELLLFLLDCSNHHISEIVSLMIDTTDYKIAEENEHLTDDGIYKHPLMLEVMNDITGKLS